MKKNKEHTKIFSTRSNLTLDEFKKIFKCVPNFYWANVKNVSRKLLLVMLAFAVIYKWNIIETILAYSIIIIIVALVYKIKINWLAQKTYEGYIKRGLIDTLVTIDFYQDYMEKITEESKIKVQYSDIARIVETEENFFILNSKNIITVNKQECNDALIKFINEIDTKNIKKVKKKQEINNNISNINIKQTRIFLLIIFWLTIFSIYGANLTVNIASRNDIAILSLKKMWLFWLWLPIPIISIILGFKYKNTEIKCKKNIVAGFIVGFILFAFGFYTFLFPTITKDYRKFNNYKDIVKIELPKDGVLTQAYYDAMFDDDKTDFTITRAMYNNSKDIKDIQQLESSISKSEYWIKFSDMKSELKAMLPTQLQNLKKNTSLLIYNKDTNEYNVLPSNEGKYHVYVAIYYPNNCTIEITDFSYNFMK